MIRLRARSCSARFSLNRAPAGAALGNPRSMTGSRLRAARQARRHHARCAAGGRPGARVLAVQRRRRSGPRHARKDIVKLPSIANNISAAPLEGFDAGQGVGDRPAVLARSTCRSPRATTSPWCAPRGAVTPMGTTPRIKVYKVAAVCRRSACRNTMRLRIHAAARGAALFQPDRRCDRDRRSIRSTRTARIAIAGWSPRPPAGRSSSSTGATRNATFFNALLVERNVMFPDPHPDRLVGALNIISGLIMLVKDKGHDIAILRTIGATQGSVMRIFLITGASIGVIGTLMGSCRPARLPQRRGDPAIPFRG